MATQAESHNANMKARMDSARREATESAQRLGEHTRDALNQARENPTPSGIVAVLEELPAGVYLWGTIGSMALSALLRMAGRKDFATFVGLWPPTILALAMMSKLLRPSREM